MLVRGIASWLVTCKLTCMCISSYMHAFMISGWLNFSVHSAPATKSMLCKMYSSTEIFIQSICWALSMQWWIYMPLILICVETNWPGGWFKIAVLDCRSLVLLINNQVLRKIKIAVESDVKNWVYIIIKSSVIKY